jgi:hypothetical protein
MLQSVVAEALGAIVALRIQEVFDMPKQANRDRVERGADLPRSVDVCTLIDQ